MKRIVALIVLLFSCISGFGQAYIPMPIDSASWRYRLWNIDYMTTVTDMLLYNNGQDTIANGKTYQVIRSRSYIQTGATGFNPPVADVVANRADIDFRAIREASKRVYELTGATERLLYDFNATIGDSIPDFTSKVRVVAIDSVLMAGVYHKRYLTSDTGFYVIEGVGSNRGLFPDFIDPLGIDQFFCFHHSPVLFTPDSVISCTYIFPVDFFGEGVKSIDNARSVNIFPNPADDVINISVSQGVEVYYFITDALGRVVQKGNCTQKERINTKNWAPGVYYCRAWNGRDIDDSYPFVISR